MQSSKYLVVAIAIVALVCNQPTFVIEAVITKMNRERTVKRKLTMFPQFADHLMESRFPYH